MHKKRKNCSSAMICARRASCHIGKTYERTKGRTDKVICRGRFPPKNCISDPIPQKLHCSSSAENGGCVCGVVTCSRLRRRLTEKPFDPSLVEARKTVQDCLISLDGYTNQISPSPPPPPLITLNSFQEEAHTRTGRSLNFTDNPARAIGLLRTYQ